MKTKVEELLKTIQDPELKLPILNRLIRFDVQGNKVSVHVFVGDLSPDKRQPLDQYLRKEFRQAFPNAEFEFQYSTQKPKEEPAHPQAKSGAPPVPTPQRIPGIKKIIAVASGKGGVGKSTISALLACAFTDLGLKVALVDADIYGPSQVQLFGCQDHPKSFSPTPDAAPKIQPVSVAQGISLMSFSFFLDIEDPVIWRGPMIMSVLRQFFFDVLWGEHDVMVIDLPPGTGDAPLSMVQSVPVDGTIIVTTPQTVSVLDAIRGANMFRKLGTPVFGIVENMSGFVCDQCHKKHTLFRKGGADVVSQRVKAPVLCRFPLYPQACEKMDQGKTWEAYLQPDIQKISRSLAKTLYKQLFPRDRKMLQA